MADFVYKPDFGYKTKPFYNVLRTKFDNKVEQRRLKTSQKLRSWELSFNNRSTTEKNAVSTFYDDKKGSLTAFSISIDGSDVTGIFVEDSFWYERIAPNVYNYGFEFEEVITSS
jgi:hypothetical protein